MRSRAAQCLRPFGVAEDDEDAFFLLLQAVGGVIIGDVAEETAVVDHNAEVKEERLHTPNCSTAKDLTIVVPGPSALSKVANWFRRLGYGFWKGRRLSEKGEITSRTDLVVGAPEMDRLRKVCSRYPSAVPSANPAFK